MSNENDWRGKLSESSSRRRASATAGMVRLHLKQYRILQHLATHMAHTQTGLVNAFIEDAYEGLLAEGAVPPIKQNEE
jgi:hypothetical protein|tara:strand:+ start:47 stop:280 length:234 start_codon:yes stop_codon:yes gene_type:complete